MDAAVQPSMVHGVGLFAARAFRAGERVYVLPPGRVIHGKEIPVAFRARTRSPRLRWEGYVRNHRAPRMLRESLLCSEY